MEVSATEIILAILGIAGAGGLGGLIASLNQKKEVEAQSKAVLTKLGPEVSQLQIKSLSDVITTLSARLESSNEEYEECREELESERRQGRELLSAFLSLLHWVKGKGEGPIPRPSDGVAEKVPENLRLWL